MLPSRVGEEPLPFHVHAGIEPPTSRFGTSNANSQNHSHRRSSSFNALRNRSRDNAPSTQNAPIISAESQSQGGNLNRWSKSTEGSAVSTTHKRSNSFSRRMSLSTSGNSFLDTSPPRKLQKSRAPASNNSPSSQIRTARPPGVGPTLINLPPINTLPNLQTSLSNYSQSIGPNTPSPSTAQILSAAARSVDYFGRFEESSTGSKDLSHKRLTSTTRTTNLGPSPIILSNTAVDGKILARHDGEEERPRSRGHSRHRSQAGKGSTGTGSSRRSSKQPSQKAMLSKALQKANTAVLLDNAQNFEGAMQAYSEACSLLQQVMLRSSGDDDRRKLEAIVSI
jgi:hypothetical protein